MAFGPIMKLTTEKGDHIELAPFTREKAARRERKGKVLSEMRTAARAAQEKNAKKGR
jgi:hypothetical protein